MVISQSLSTFSLCLVALCLAYCAHPTSSHSPRDDNPLAEGHIDYPFAEDSKTIGRDGREDKLVIKSTVGQTEYELQIPGAARDYDVEVPLADMRKVGAIDTSASAEIDANLKPQTIDNEFAKDMPKLEDPDDRALVEGAYGVGNADGPKQSPSYTLKINKINRLFLARQYELALIEINDLLAYYPTSVKLYKMKGTILVKTRNYKMAELAWSRGIELNPDDAQLRRGLESLRKRMDFDKKTDPVSGAPIMPATPSLQPAH